MGPPNYCPAARIGLRGELGGNIVAPSYKASKRTTVMASSLKTGTQHHKLHRGVSLVQARSHEDEVVMDAT